MKRVAWIRDVIDVMSSCFCSENTYFIAEDSLWYWIVSRKVVMNVVMLNIEFEMKDRIKAKLPNSTLNKLVPVSNTVFRLSLLILSPL